MHLNKHLQAYLYPYIVATQTIPIIAISPLFIVWFDYSIWSKVAVVVLWCFFPIVVSIMDGFRSVSLEKKEMLLSLGASRWTLFRFLEFPTVLPYFFSGLQMAGAYAVIGATVGEWLGAEKGLGFLARRASANLQTELLFVAVFVLCIMGITMFYFFKWLAHRTINWQNKK
jgi:putative hydroxymethylpyrimidine transport system permease protein